MKKILGCLAGVVLLSQVGAAQSKYIIRFRDKGGNPYALNNPSAFLSARSIARRTFYSIGYDSTDLPVTPRYVDSLRLAGSVTILNVSKWLNSISIQTTDAAAISKINSFPFVLSVTTIAPRLTGTTTPVDKFAIEKNNGASGSAREMGVTANYFNYGNSFNQIHIHKGEFLHNIGLRGQNVVIGILDAGFYQFTTANSLDSIRTNGQILGIYDFVARDSSVAEDNSHGLNCLSIMAANIPGVMVGTAPKASFYLFRSEDASSEYPIEEHNWVCAAERVDSVGGNLISSSLGYNTFDAPFSAYSHTYADMNGDNTLPAIGADLAAKKGILVVNSAGNEGNNSWHYIITPADGDSVMAVGAVDTLGNVGSFSSYGPSSDGQVKPDVASVGVQTYLQGANNSITTGNGTSYSCPNLAGLTACLWQGFPEFNNMKIINAMRQAGSIAGSPNNRIGYGIPDVKKALMNLLKDFATSTASISNCRTTLNWTSKDMSAMKYEIERMLPGQSSFTKIGEQAGSGNVFATRPAYQFQDVLTGVAAGTISYRIREVVDTASSSLTADYITTTTVNLSATCTATAVDPVDPSAYAVILMPNPTPGPVTLKITTARPVENLLIRVVNEQGQEMRRMKKSKTSGTASFSLPMQSFARGKYYVMVYDNNKLLSTKELVRL
jgi:hypothetical protein